MFAWVKRLGKRWVARWDWGRLVRRLEEGLKVWWLVSGRVMGERSLLRGKC
jgi:hypothetical protein